jgi:dihydroorotate dehydrogenase
VDDPITLAGLRFPNRIGCAAGLDKNGRCIDGLGAMGFGFIEVGTVTPLPQAGNPKPRMFRLESHQALINRLGFNNDGLAAFLRNVRGARSFRQRGGILGLNIGKNAATPLDRATDDYLLGLEGVYPHADYITVNISSPNTRDLRALQHDQALDGLLSALLASRSHLRQVHQREVPIFLKIAPDLDTEQVQAVARAIQAHGVDGVVATNTTVSRQAVAAHPLGNEEGGLSGAPLAQASNVVISQLRQVLGPQTPIIGVGGVIDGATAQDKIRAGADVVQIYTGLIYRGPELVTEAARAVAALRATAA